MPVTIREAQCADANGIAQVHVASWRTSYRHILPDTYLAHLSEAAYSTMWRGALCALNRDQFIYVAEDAERIVGFASGGKERNHDPQFTGELYAIYLLEAYQRQGVGRRLVKAIVDRLWQADMRAMLVWALAENPARQFYVNLGGKFVRTQQITIGGNDYDEQGYGWHDLAALRDQLHATQ
jgi:GNAT superfamily N-acetyltransferase